MWLFLRLLSVSAVAKNSFAISYRLVHKWCMDISFLLFYVVHIHPFCANETSRPAAEPTGNESRKTGMSSTGYITRSAISWDLAMMLTWHKERMYSIRFHRGSLYCLARIYWKWLSSHNPHREFRMTILAIHPEWCNSKENWSGQCTRRNSVVYRKKQSVSPRNLKILIFLSLLVIGNLYL